MVLLVAELDLLPCIDGFGKHFNYPANNSHSCSTIKRQPFSTTIKACNYQLHAVNGEGTAFHAIAFRHVV